MKKFTLVALALGAATVASAQSNYIYGLSQGSTGGKVEIVHVNTGSGDLVKFADLGNIAGDVNGLASVLGTAKFYFASGNTFYGYDFNAAAGSQLTKFTGSMSASVDDGAWYNGKYYWVRDANLYALSPDVATKTFTQSLVHSFGSSFGTFGDISFNTTSSNAGDGTMYLASGTGIHKYNVNTNSFSTLKAVTGQQMQLGFAQDNNLYGVWSGGSTAEVEKIYNIDILTGNRTLVSTVSNGASVYIRDAATAPSPPVPEPASMAVLGLGLAALKRRRAKK